jgi:hypothetical protein
MRVYLPKTKEFILQKGEKRANEVAKLELIQAQPFEATTTTQHHQKIRIHHGFVSLTPNKGEQHDRPVTTYSGFPL